MHHTFSRKFLQFWARLKVDFRVVAFPLVYALLTSKESEQYTTVLNAVKNSSEKYRIVCSSNKILTDFELAIINATSSMYSDSPIKCCFFHLCKSIYRKVQEFGLQVQYPNDNTLNIYVRIIMGIEFVPTLDVCQVFNLLRDICPRTVAYY